MNGVARTPPRPHPRTLGWISTTALAMGGSNQSLFIMGALFVGQGSILGQGTAAVPLLVAGLLLAWAAAPGWTELVLMYPNRVGGIAASCVDAFRPYSPVLANLTGVCYWWGWVPTCGLTAILSASALHQWYLPGVPVSRLATFVVLVFTAVNLCGVKWVGRLAIPIATMSGLLAFLSGLLPIGAGFVDWRRAAHFELVSPFAGAFGAVTSLMAGLYLVGFAAPAFEAAACHVGETANPNRNVPRAMLASALLAALFFIVLPMVWLGTLGSAPLGEDLALVLGPTFSPLFGDAARAVAIWFMVFSMFSGTLQPLAGASRTLAQLAEDGLLPDVLGRRSRLDVPWVATLVTAAMSILFLLIGDPIWLIAAANFTYLIGIALPSVAVWLLRRDQPEAKRPYRAPRGTIVLGVGAAAVWGLSALLGFEQFGLPTVVVGLVFAYSGSALFGIRRYLDRKRAGSSALGYGLQLKLTGAMLLVLMLDGAGYLLAVQNLPPANGAMLTVLSDIFVAVAMLSISVALILPGMIGHSAMEVALAARRLASGPVADFSRAMRALGRGDVGEADGHFEFHPVLVYTHDEVGEMAASFNLLQSEIGNAVEGLDAARAGLRRTRRELTSVNEDLQQRIEELHRADEKLSGVLESIDNIIWSADAGSGAMIYANPAIERVYGRPAQAFADNPQLWCELIHAEDRAVMAHWLKNMAPGRSYAQQYRILHADGQTRWLESSARLICDEQGCAVRIDGVSTDISGRKSHEQQMAYLARHDALTDLPNRVLLKIRIDEALARARRDGGGIALLFLDLDGFKFINDSFGHTLGDALLQSVAARLLDIVGEGDTVARLGGDEFVIMLPQSPAPGAAAEMARRLLQEFGRAFPVQGHSLHVTASIGISEFPQDGDSGEVLMKHADAAMYRAKQMGRNAFECYVQEMGAQTDARVKLEAALRLALEFNEFELHYEPFIDLATTRIRGMETLIRWRHPELGMVAPERFISLAEETGLIVPIGAWVLRTACRQLRAWHDAGHTQLVMAVNVSARQFYQQDVVALVSDALAESGLLSRHLQLELTESGLMQNPDAASGTLRRLRAMGVAIAMDDFGTGYSSLSNLTRFPIDVLKIDQSFIRDLPNSADAASIVRAIIAMADSLNLHTVGEGVESIRQLEHLRLGGCQSVQGHLFCRSRTAQQMTSLLLSEPAWMRSVLSQAVSGWRSHPALEVPVLQRQRR